MLWYSTSYPQVIHKMWIMLRQPKNSSTLGVKTEKMFREIGLDESGVYEYN